MHFIVLVPPDFIDQPEVTSRGFALATFGDGADVGWYPPTKDLPAGKKNILTAEHLFLSDDALAARCQSAFALEVVRPEELHRAKKFGLSRVVIKGRESGGLIGKTPGEALLKEARALGLEVIYRGAVSPYNAAALFELGAEALVIEAALYLTLPLHQELRSRIEGLSLEDLRSFSVGGGLALSMYGGVSNQSARRIAAAPESERLSLAASHLTSWSGDIANHPWLLGQDALLAKGVMSRYETLSALLDVLSSSGGVQRRPGDPSGDRIRMDVRVVRHTGKPEHDGQESRSDGVVASRYEEVFPLLERGAARLVLRVESLPLLSLWIEPITRAISLGYAVKEIIIESDFASDASAFLASVQAAPLSRMNCNVLLQPRISPTRPSAWSPLSSRGEGQGRGPKEPMSYTNDPSKEPIAIVGMGARLPGGNSAPSFWKFIIERGDAIRKVPKERWDPSLYFDPDPKAVDRSYTDIGGWVTDFSFDRKAYRIPPNVVQHVDPAQQLALATAEEAFNDAGLLQKDWDRSRCAIILGNSMGGELTDIHTKRLTFPEVLDALKTVESFARLPEMMRQEFMAQFEARYKSRIPEITEDTMPGELSNVISGRISNVFDIGGPNFTCDAACASTSAAIDNAIRGLRAREYDVVLSGGVDRQMGPGTFIKFCKIGALSGDNSYPFDARASGFVMGEGAALFVLKRLSDAVRDKDKIYGLLLGSGGSSDGRGKGIAAPNPQGQLRAMRKAYENTQIDPTTVRLIEAHGTSTKVGDVVEVQCLAEVFKEAKTPIALGSVKSQIGHLKSAAAAAGLLKVAMALHTKTLPPQIRYEKANPNLELEKTTFKVQTITEPWESNGPRRAGVSAFGFGGVNFHLVLEEYTEESTKKYLSSSSVSPVLARVDTTVSREAPRQAAGSSNREKSLDSRLRGNDGGSDKQPDMNSTILLLGAPSKTALVEKLKVALSAIKNSGDGPKGAEENFRFAMSMEGDKERNEVLAKAIELLEANKPLTMLENKGAYYREGAKAGKLAFLFPGQGSQHLWMAEGVKAKYPAFAKVWELADSLSQELLQKKLSDNVFVAKDLSEDKQSQAFTRLSHTATAQPAIFTTDLAYAALLESFGIKPEMVVGHSLGEYAAAVAAGLGPFEVGFRAVCSRGNAMGALQIADPGKMAGISAPYSVVQEVLSQVSGYIVAANKNCPSQTVIAGESRAVEEALQKFGTRGIAGVVLPVSHAFHSSIVAPASEPLRQVLAKLPMETPKIPIVSNVTAQFYPTGPTPEEAVTQIRELLARQVASPVEFTNCIETMYAAGARIFIEVGPKRALSSFVSNILGERQHRTYITNDPKRGDVPSFHRALAALAAEGFGGAAGESTLPSSPGSAPSSSGLTGGPIRRNPESQMDPRVARSASAARTLPEDDGKRRGDGAEVGYTMTLGSPVVSGIAIGLPGGTHVFSAKNFDSILAGENRISSVPEEIRQRIVDKQIVRVVKDAQRGGGDFQRVSSTEEVIKLAGRAGILDLVKEYGIEASFVDALDRTSQLALAAGIEALKDAGIPLVRVFKTTQSGAKIGAGWRIPEALADETGIIFASAFPGYNQLIEQLNEHAELKQRKAMIAAYRELEAALPEPQRSMVAQKRKLLEDKAQPTFDRRFLFEVLSMGHSQFAQWLGARGPNTQVNAACASTTQAIAIAEDWIRLHRCRRVLVVGADDVTSDTFFEWVGAGFLAAGAATTEGDVTRAALPFDRRRHGMIVGMGAVALVIEEQSTLKARGVLPVAEIVATRIANSAFHGSRLDTEHIAREVERLVDTAVERTGVSRQEMAKKCVFMSHETYTPARGGAAAAEIAALRRAFGEAASSVVIANTKGFTGHPMGAGIEDAVVLKALQKQIIPPIANLQQPDPELGDLSLSKGGHYPVEFALRLAAGFGSQLALSLYRRTAGEDRIQPLRYAAWLKEISGLNHPATTVVDGVLRVIEDTTQPAEKREAAIETPKPSAPPVAAKPTISRAQIKERLFVLVSDKTGYGISELEEGFSLEADLGIDTVKQAEIIAAVRDAYGLARDESFRLSDYPTLAALIDYTLKRTSPRLEDSPTLTTLTNGEGGALSSATVSEAAVSTPSASREQIKEKLFLLVSDKTGYGISELEEGFSLEADLGIDTVKQAEIIAAVRDAYGLARDESFRLSDYPTLSALIDYTLKRTRSLSSSVGEGGPSETRRREFADPPMVGEAPVVEAPSKQEEKVEPVALAVIAPKVVNGVAPSVRREQIKDKLFSLVGDKTGYSTSELEESFSLEADLGIDTVKQAEIIAAVRDAYGLARDESFRLSDYPTLAALIDYTLKRTQILSPSHDERGNQIASGTSVGEVRVRPEEAKPVVSQPESFAPAASLSIRREQIKDKLFSLVGDKTGYATSELEEGFSLEADLGIDTVKQAEIIAAVRDAYGLARDESFRLSDYPTLSALIDYTLKRTSPQLDLSTNEVSVSLSGSVGEGAEDLSRRSHADLRPDESEVQPGLQLPFQARRVITAALPAISGKRVDGRYIVIAASLSSSDPIVAALKSSGVDCSLLIVTQKHAFDEAWLSSYLDSCGIELASGVINALSLAPVEDHTADIHWRARALFHVARVISQKFNARVPQSFRLLTLLSGQDVLSMAQAGLTKSLAKEWSNSSKILLADNATMSSVLVKELSNSDSLFVSYTNNQRSTTTLDDGALTPVRGVDLRGKNIVITGGARGVTAEIAKLLAVQGANVILMGATPLPHDIEQHFASVDVAQIRETIKSQMQSRGERVTPAALDASVAPLKKQLEIAKNLAALRQQSKAIYLSVDTSNQNVLSAAIESARKQLGPIFGAIHGAGIEESRLLAQKDGAAFDRIFNGKALGALYLWGAIQQDNPRFFMAMSSVAGYFGNPGQPDYCAANASMSGLCSRISQTTTTRAVSLDWTAWDEVGMAVRGGMKRLLQDRGVDLLPASQGSAFALYAIHAGLIGEYIVAGKLGDFDTPSSPSSSGEGERSSFASEVQQTLPSTPVRRQALLDRPGDPSDSRKLPDGPVVRHTGQRPSALPEGDGRIQTQQRDRLPPLIEKIVSEIPGQKIVASRKLDPTQDKFLSDHAFDGTPLLPGVVGVEMMAQVASLLENDAAITEVKDVEFLRPVKVFAGKDIEVFIQAEKLPSGEIQGKLLSRREGANGKILESEHFAAKFISGSGADRSPFPVPRSLLLDIGAYTHQGPSKEQVYQRFFHGPSFQVVASIDAVGRHGASATYALPEIEVPELHTVPLLRELAFQAAGMHAMITENQVALPAGIGCVKRYAPYPHGAKLTARVVFRGRDERGHFCYDTEVRGPDGALLDVMENLRLVPARLLEEKLRLSLPEEPPMEVVVVNMGPIANTLLNAPELLVESWLSPKERVKFSSFALEKRRIEWVSGRIAAKRLMRAYLLRRFAIELSPVCIEVEADSNGAPHCQIDPRAFSAPVRHTGEGRYPELAYEPLTLPEISITHSGEVAAAALAYGGRPGIDVERIERRDDSFRNHCFTEHEARLASGDDEPAALTRFFSLKEAVSKSLGVGFALDPREIEVVGLGLDGNAQMALHGRAKDHFAKLGGTRLEASVETRGAYAYAQARITTHRNGHA